MKSLDSQIRQKQFRFGDGQRRISQLEGMITELKRRCSDLQHDINLEHSRTKIADPHHFAYSPLAKSLAQNRTNLERTVQTFEAQLENEKGAVSQALAILHDLEGRRGVEYANRSSETSTDPNTISGSTVPVGST